MKERFAVGETIFTDSGRTALKLSLSFLNRKSNRVGLPGYTCPVLFEVILGAGFEPVAIDIEPRTMELNGEQLSEESSRGLDALILVHLFGDPVSLKKTRGLISDIPIIEDCAQGIGAVKDSKPVGSDGDIAIFSFGFGKTITGGIGGALSINSNIFHEKTVDIISELRKAGYSQRMRALFRMTGMKFGSFSPLYEVAYPLLSSRNRDDEQKSVERITRQKPAIPDPSKLSSCICAAVSSQLGKIDSIVSERRRNARSLVQSLENANLEFGLSEQAETFESTFTRFVLRVSPRTRAMLEKALLKNGIEVESPYRSVLEKLYRSDVDKYLGVQTLISQSLSLPVHNRMNENKIRRLSEVVKKVAGVSHN